MQRRALLRKLGGVTAIGAFAGCTSVQAPGNDDQNDPTTDPGTTPSEPGPVVDELRIGNRDNVDFPETHRPHGITVVNDVDNTRDIGVELTDGDGSVLVEDSWSVPADGRIVMTLNEPDQYTLAVRLDGEDLGPVSPQAGSFDCNDSQTTVTVGPNGELDSRTISTAVACASPEVVDTTFTETGSGCADGGEEQQPVASLTAADEQVSIAGEMRVPNPCYGATLESASISEGPEHVLTVRIAQTDPDEDGACVECVGAVEYETTISLDIDYPRTVVLEYRHMGDTEEVARFTIDE